MLGGDYWFPHVPLAVLLAVGGVWLLQADLGRHWVDYSTAVLHGRFDFDPRALPPLLVGGGMLTMALGLLWRSRLAWTMAILRQAPVDPNEERASDIVYGEPSNLEVLRNAGVDKAEAVLAMQADDSENAFVILAVNELGGSARTVAAVNDADHLDRLQLVQPDVVIAPQVLGGELLAMLLSGEQITADFVMQRLLQEKPTDKQA